MRLYETRAPRWCLWGLSVVSLVCAMAALVM